ncbi:hypothetical protein [Flavobacterium crassostreae]|uniref:Uncharacterized protein n=1 Tax=Flavobacterium crassostreae TaxID=1763534 RepID=A0A1B9E5G1_9FLAO|nr:hypothetical protein [Flavobacterium crassostreae]OCB77200.1 hypothetical protein LPBF_04155 [Flavobacterium crassostreae]
MIQPWIHKAKTDSFFILLPSFLVVAIVFLFQKQLQLIEEQYSFYTWLILVVFIDVAHVYATLFKTYFVKTEFQKRKKLLIGLPILCFLMGLVLFSLGSAVFWSALAYIAVFHFIRQQYGFMRLYARNESKKWVWIDNAIIYTATIYPMLFWFLSPSRKFNWFVENEFYMFENPLLLKIFGWVYLFILLIYITRTVYQSLKKNTFNIPKNAIIVGTILSWYFGIVYFNTDLVFTLLNVVSHGIPYIALIYLNEIEKKSKTELGFLYQFKQYKGIIIFIMVLLLIAFSEEYLWELLIWNEQFSGTNLHLQNWHFIIIPLLTVPQFTHYLLDGFIWKSKS